MALICEGHGFNYIAQRQTKITQTNLSFLVLISKLFPFLLDYWFVNEEANIYLIL